MKTALIGYTGFVGGNIHSQMKFDDLYNSKNINDIIGKEYDLVVCAGVSAVKWWSNQNPLEDSEGIQKLVSSLKGVQAKRFVLISTVDVYPTPQGFDEDFIPSTNDDTAGAYGRNRLLLEKEISEMFSKTTVIRLPGLFGNGLKKNIIFDLINNNQTENIIPNYCLQYYNLNNIGKDISTCIENDIKLINFNSEGVYSSDIIYMFQHATVGKDSDSPLTYNILSKHAPIFGGKDKYMYSQKQVLKDIKEFIQNNNK